MTEVVKTHELMLSLPPKGVSSQPLAETEDAFVTRMTGSGILEPPVPLRTLAALTQSNGQRRAIIEAIARNTVGLGYAIDVDRGHENDESMNRQRQRAEHTLEALARRDRRTHQPSLTELLYMVKWDEEECGNGYIEVSRSRLSGEIDGLYYVPGVRVRRLRERDGWVLLPPDELPDQRKVIRFYNFGEKVVPNEDETPTNRLQPGCRWARNELIPFQLFTSESVDYGLPRDNALGIDYAGDKMASETNLSFFDSSGTPPKLIFVQGERQEGPGGSVQFVVPPGLTQSIGELIKSDGGAQKRVGIIPLPPGSQTNEVELGQISDRDIGFTEYRKSILRNQLGAFRISPIFVSSAEAGRYTAEVERAITLEQVFDPDQRRWEDRLHETVYKDLGIAQLVHRFKRLAIEGDATRRESARALAERGALTNREYRAAHGLGPLPEAPEGQDPEGPQVPHGWNDELVVGDKGPPPSEREVAAADDQRGLKPRLAGREVRQQDPALANGDSPLPPD